MVEMLKDQEIRRRRAAALARISVSERELRARGRRWQLNAEELAVLEEIDGYDYLLRGVTPPW